MSMGENGSRLAQISQTMSVAVVMSALVIAWPVEDLTVIDGDTVRRGYVVWRLAGFDAPEIRRAKCPAEREAGKRARERLRAIVRGPHRLVDLGRSGGFGRRLGRLEAGGEDVAAIALREGWAVPLHTDGGWCG